MKSHRDVVLNIRPIYVTLHHDYVFEGPCRAGGGEQLTKAYDDMLNAARIAAAGGELSKELGSNPHYHVLEPAWIDRNEEFLVLDTDLDRMLEGNEQVDVYLLGEMSRMSDLMIPFAQRAGKPLIAAPNASAVCTILSASLRAGDWRDVLLLHLGRGPGHAGCAANQKNPAPDQNAVYLPLWQHPQRQRNG